MTWVRDKVHSLARDGVFGSRDIVKVEDNNRLIDGTQFGAQLSFLKVTMKNEDGSTTVLPIVVKSQTEYEQSFIMDGRSQFHNEALFYNAILPIFECCRHKLTPKSFYSNSTNGKNMTSDLIIMEDLAYKNYKGAKNTFLDKDHIMAVMKTLGRFHGMSYKINKSAPGILAGLGKKLRMVDRCRISYFKSAVKHAQMRGFQPVIDDNPQDPLLKTVLDTIIDTPLDIQRSIFVKTDDRNAVILHGDVAKDNILFKYDKSGRVISAIIFDFGYGSYGDATTDVSFFLYMHTSQETRLTHWDDFLHCYWDGVLSIESDPGLTFDEFKFNFSKRALYGFLNASFFIPILLEKENDNAGEYFKMAEEEGWIHLALTNGGERGTLIISDIIRHMLKNGYLENFVKNFNFFTE